jgi:cysteine desulfurase
VTSVYLDYNATAPIRPEAASAAARALAIGGNPSSVHAAGRSARAAVERARDQVAGLVGVKPGSVTFTSGGTEANALAIESAVAAGAGRLLVSMTDHVSVLATAAAAGFCTEAWPVTCDGVADLDWLERRLKDWKAEDGAPFAALSLANNETGVIQPVSQAAALLHAASGWLHVDAVQAVGKIAVSFADTGADTLSLSSHKLGGPQGAGALIAGPRATLSRRLHGGGQERGRRAGTENVSGIAGFGAAAEASVRDLTLAAGQAPWRDAAQSRLAQEADIEVFGAKVPRLPGVLCFGCEGFDAERQVMALDLDGVMVSAGAACSSGKMAASQVLIAMGFPVLANSAIRVSGGWASTEADWIRFADVWLAAHARRQRRRSAA